MLPKRYKLGFHVSHSNVRGLEEQNVFSTFFTMAPDIGALYNTKKAADQTGEEM